MGIRHSDGRPFIPFSTDYVILLWTVLLLCITVWQLCMTVHYCAMTVHYYVLTGCALMGCALMDCALMDCAFPLFPCFCSSPLFLWKTFQGLGFWVCSLYIVPLLVVLVSIPSPPSSQSSSHPLAMSSVPMTHWVSWFGSSVIWIIT